MKKLVISKLVLMILMFFTVQITAMADGGHDRDHGKSRCDVVSLSGTGKLLEDGRIVGSEVFTIVGKDKHFEVDFSLVQLGALGLDQATGALTIAASHNFTGVKDHSVNFTTFDEITIVPLGGSDVTCVQNACGLIFKLKLETGHGRYNCGEVVSGLNPDPSAPIPFTSYVNPLSPAPDGGTVTLNSLGKLCKCSAKN